MKAFPKMDLHLHLDGSVRPETAWELMGEQGLSLPGCKSAADCARRMAVGEESDSLLAYFRSFEIPGAVLRTPAALTRVTEELIEDLDRDGVRYAELRFAPQLHRPLTQCQAAEAVLLGCRRGQAAHPRVRVGMILCAMSFGDPAKNARENRETLELCAALPGQAAFDLAGEEVSLDGFAELFREAARRGVPFTVHAGEALGPENVARALDLGARRIGHGIHAADDPAVVRRLTDGGVTLEVSVTSNVQTRSAAGYGTHPIRALYDAGVALTVCTDNRTCSQTSLEREYALLKRHLSFTDEELIRTNLCAVRAAFFLSEGEKRELERELERELRAAAIKQ